MEDTIKEFWKCSLASDFADFDFDAAFEMFLPYLHSNNAMHGLCDFEEFVETQEDFYNDTGLNEFAWPYIGFDANDAFRGIMFAKWEAGRRFFQNDGIHGYLWELEQKLESKLPTKIPQLVELFDECIHAEHCNGMIIEDIDLDDIRAEAEEEYNEDKERFPTNIRAFL